MNNKTLVISEIFPPKHGGSGRWFYELYSRLPANEFVIVAGSTENDTTFDYSTDLDISRMELSSRQWGVKTLVGFKYYLKAFLALRKIVKSRNIKSIHCGRCLPEGVFGWLFYKFYRIPYLCYVHGEDVETAHSSRELKFIIRNVLNNARLVIANSLNSKNILLDRWGASSEKVKVLNPGMDASRFVPAANNSEVIRKLGWQDRIVLLTVGRLQKRKGQDMLIQALPIIKKEFHNILYSIIGDGEELSNLQELSTNLNLQNNVQFLLELSDKELIECYQQCTIFVLPNRTINGDIEGFGMVLAEAQACGKPVIAGDSGGTAETMIVGVTGDIADCTAPEPLANTIIDFLRKRDSFNIIGQQARKHVVDSLNWPAHVDKAVSLFRLLD